MVTSVELFVDLVKVKQKMKVNRKVEHAIEHCVQVSFKIIIIFKPRYKQVPLIELVVDIKLKCLLFEKIVKRHNLKLASNQFSL